MANESQRTTDSQGRAFFNYTAPGISGGKVPINMTFTVDGQTADPRNETTVRFNVTQSGDSRESGGDEINPGGIVLERVTVNTDTVSLTLNNTANETRTIQRARISFYSSTTGNPPSYADLEGNTNDRLTFGDPYEAVTNIPFSAGQERSPANGNAVELAFDRGPSKNDFFIFSVIFDNGEVARYFVGIP